MKNKVYYLEDENDAKMMAITATDNERTAIIIDRQDFTSDEITRKYCEECDCGNVVGMDAEWMISEYGNFDIIILDTEFDPEDYAIHELIREL